MNDSEHPGAQFVILVFKAAAIVSIIGSVVIAFDDSIVESAKIALAFGAIVGAAMFAFFAYVLEYLAEIRDNTDQIPVIETMSVQTVGDE